MFAFDELNPDSEAYESFQKFCIATGIEACHPRKEELHYYLLDHPTTGKSLILVYDKGPHERFYLIEMTEGKMISLDHPDEEAFHSWTVGKSPLPSTAVIGPRPQVTLSYTPDPNRPEITECKVVDLWKYLLLRGLFDEENPFPWIEVDEKSLIQ